LGPRVVYEILNTWRDLGEVKCGSELADMYQVVWPVEHSTVQFVVCK